MICKHCDHERLRHVVMRADEDSQLTDEQLEDFEKRLKVANSKLGGSSSDPGVESARLTGRTTKK